jgi:sporulation protein YlmC with PRC-barrel domain
MASEERLRELEEKYEGFTVYDNRGSKIGKVDDLFVDEKDHEEYIGVKMGFLGMKSTLIPMEVTRVNESDRTIEVSESKDRVKDAPSFDDDEDVTAEYEERIRRHFGLESLQEQSGRGSYGASGGTAATGTAAETSDRDEAREAGSSGHAPEGDRETPAGETHEDVRAGDGGTSGGTFETGRETASDADHGEHRDDSSTTAGVDQTGTSESSGEAGGSQDFGTSGTGGTSQEGTSGSRPTTSRQTEETETFQEGGRTKVRRRIIREEVVDADDQ